MKTLDVQPLTAAAFAPFGDVISIDAATQHFPINGGRAERYHDLAHINTGADGKPIISIVRSQPSTLPLTVFMMERHPLGSQAFIPLSGQPYLVIVARPGAAPTIEDLHAFMAKPDQGINYAAGTWHHPLVALNSVSDFLVVDRSGPGENCDEVKLGVEGMIQLETE